MGNNSSSTISMKKFIHTYLGAHKCDERFCFILGSGASRESGIHTGVELARLWANELPNIYNEDELKKLGDITPSSKNYFNIYKHRFHPDYKQGYKALEREMEDAKPSIGYYTLASILANTEYHTNLVITTNFDSLVEDALFIYTNKKPIVVGHESLTQYININTTRPIIAKVHRSLFFNPLNSEEETNELPEEWHKILETIFQVYTPIVIGYAGGDKSLMEFLCGNNCQLKKSIYWCYWNKDKLEDENYKEIVELVNKSKGYFVPIGGFDTLMLHLSSALKLEHPKEKIEVTAKARIDEYNKALSEFEKTLNEENKGVESQESKETKRILNNNVWDRGIAECNEAININPYDASAYLMRGNYFLLKGRHLDAISDYTKAIELEPNYFSAYINRGNAFADIKDYNRAIADFDKYVGLSQDDIRVYYYRGNAFWGNKNYDKAIDDYNKTIELDPNFAHAYLTRAAAYRALAEQETAKGNTEAAQKHEVDALADEQKAKELENAKH